MASSPLLATVSLQHISLGFPGRKLLQHFSADITQGEFIGVFGPNGAGKSTLLRALLGLVTPAEGSIAILGKPAKYGNAVIGYMPQTRLNLRTYNLSGRAVISAAYRGHRWGIPLTAKGVNYEVDRVSDLVEASTYLDKPFNALSGGERQRLLFAQTLFDNPQILLLDEPLNHLDPYNQDLLMRLIQRVQKEFQTTIFFTAHDVNPLLPVMDRALYMARGNAIIGNVHEVITSEKLTALYQAPMEVIKHAQRLFVFSQESGEIEHATH